jgi:competence protein ComEC
VTEWLAVARLYARHLLLFALVAGLLCGGWAPWLAAPVALVGLWVAGRPALALAVVVAVLAGALGAQARRAAIDGGVLPVRLGTTLATRATLLEPLHERASGEVVARVHVRGETLLLKAPDRTRVAGETGDVLAVRGRLVALDDYDMVQRRRGALAALLVDSARPTGERRAGLLGALDGVRRRAERGLQAGVPRAESALMEGMVLGRDDLIDAPTKAAFQASGLAHLLAVSGTNVLLLATLALAAGALLGTRLRARLIAAIALVALYVPLTGAGPSIQRAGVMGIAGLVAALAGRPSSRAYALGLAAAVTLTVNPYAAADAGWQLSFAAVIGLMVLTPRLRFTRLPRPLAEAAAMTTAATLATAPLLAVHFGRVSLASLPANLVVAPVVAPIMWLGMLAGAVAQVAPPLALPLNVVAAPLVGFVDRVADVAAGVPHGVLALRLPGLLGALAGYAVLALAWRAPRLALAGGAVAAALALTHDGSRPPPGPGETVVSFLDIGQGDATLIQRDGRSILFDTGPPGGPILSRLTEVGVRRLDLLVTTHAQADHEGMAVPVIDRFHPRVVVDGGRGWPTAVQRALPPAAAQAGARITTAAAGDVLRLGALELAFLSPTAATERLPPVGDPNNRALVAHLSSGAFDLLLTADAESDVTGTLDLPRIEALKVAHHGSADPGLPAELEQLQPEVAAIEVGRHNTYGHPTPSTLRALRGVPHVYRTDHDGTVQLHVTAERMWVTRISHD